MAKNIKRIVLTHHELLESIAIVGAMKQIAAKQHNKAEAMLLDDLNNKLLKFDLDFDGAYLRLDNLTRYSLWSCIEKYICFCAETHQHDEYVLAVTIATKLSG